MYHLLPRTAWLSLPLAMILALLNPNFATAQATASQCANSLSQFTELSLRLEKQINQDTANWKEHFDKDAYWEHMHQFSQVVDAGRKHLSDCSEWDSTKDEILVLREIAQGLLNTTQRVDAIPIFRRCIGLDKEDVACWWGLSEAYFETCQFDDSRKAASAIIQIGGFNETAESYVKMAKSKISMIDGFTPTTEKSWRELYDCSTEQNEERSVEKRLGSGFFVSRQGYILTNNHVVEGCKTLAISGGKQLIVVDRHPSVDLALLKMDGVPDAVATFRGGPVPKAGDTVFAFGFPLPDVLSSEGNISTGMVSATSGINDDVRFIQISAPVQPGNSGGPLLDSSGNVIGVVVAKLDALAMARMNGDVPQNVNFAIHWTEINSFLEEEGIQYVRKPSLKKMNPNQIAESAKSYSIKIECTE
jgi:S1-C subfamily serine protease